MAEQYTPKAVRMHDDTRAAILRVASRSTSLQVLLNHIAWLETEGRTAYVEQQEAARNTPYRDQGKGDRPRPDWLPGGD